jgi:hypothetical protein
MTSALSLADLRIPDDHTLFLSADTGTFMSALLVAVSRDFHAFVLAEFPNYRYVSDQIELNNLSTPEWAAAVVTVTKALGGSPKAWADPNTQFRAELRHYGLHLRANRIGPDVRVTIAREYFRHDRVHLAPWLQILPYELENAKWPDAPTSGGRYTRLRKHDHTLVCLEHVLSRRPRATLPKAARTKTFLEQYILDHRIPGYRTGTDIHLGVE